MSNLWWRYVASRFHRKQDSRAGRTPLRSRLRRLPPAPPRPQLASEELEAVYSGAYFQCSAPVERLSGVAAAPADYATEVVKSRLDKFVDTLRTIKALNPSAVKLLDVGAATGDFVRAARELGFDAEGIELSEFAVGQADRLNAVRLRRVVARRCPGQ